MELVKFFIEKFRMPSNGKDPSHLPKPKKWTPEFGLERKYFESY